MANANNIVIGLAQITINGVDIGYVRDGVTITYGKEVREVKASQAVGTVKVFKVDETMTVSTNMLESTLENLRIAMNLPAASLSGSTLHLGYDNACDLNEYQVVIKGVSPNCGIRTYTFYKCVATGEVETALNNDEETIIPIEMICLKDPNNNNEFGIVVDS